MGMVLAVIGAITSIAGGFAGAAEAKQQAAARNASLEADAAVAQQNAQIAQQNAHLESQRRADELRDSRRKFNLLQGTARAQSGALGIFGGSTLDVLADIGTQAMFEQNSIIRERTSAELNAKAQGANEMTRAHGLLASRTSGSAAAMASIIGGFGSATSIIVGGLSQSMANSAGGA